MTAAANGPAGATASAPATATGAYSFYANLNCAAEL